MKKVLLFLCLLSIISFSGCKKENNNVASNQSQITSEQEEKAIQEEIDALENKAVFDVTVDEMSESLKNNKKLNLMNDKDLCIFQDKDKRFEIQIGSWETNISEIYYTIYNKSPLDDDKLYDDFYETVNIIFSKLGQTLEKDIIDDEFKKITKKDQTLEFEYSDSIKLFIGKMENSFDFRIYPLKQ